MSGQEGLKKEYRKDLFVQKLIEALTGALGGNLWGVVLFGSQARREGKVVSDWDVFILADGVPDNPVERTISFQNILFKSGIRSVSPIIRTREEFERNLRPIYLDIAFDGIVLFDRDEYVESKLKEIRGIIRKHGLQREEKKGNFSWKWKNPPRPGAWKIEWEK
ncbi:MAG: nucleotidyltransferase domain-containing protein [Proteobacteria bacterium]|nr:nucleotidyltransferase domain-containing protein [Pseudomonadota bacterium]